ncbi:T9SS type A sorting domain-containing protein [bacterium]|nr:T9SS type A sorting domain-containing protein [bacterium]
MMLNSFLNGQVGIPDKWVNYHVDGHHLTLPYYGNHELDSTLSNIKTAIISIHGDGRNANEHYNILSNAASNNDLLDSTFIIAPLYLVQGDVIDHNLDSTALFWPSGDWNAGDLSRNTGTNPRSAQISSFSTLDTIYHRLVNNCPNLESLVLTGHSAGSQMVVRYAAGGRAQQDLESEHDIDFRYIPTNSPSFLYLDEARVVDENAQVYAFEPSALCWSANYYKYGLGSLNDYMEDSGVDFIRDQYFHQDITILIGQYDTGGQSTNCARDIQGDNRRSRSYIFFGYLAYYYGDEVYTNHQLAELPGVYHEFWQVVNSECGMNTILGLGECSQYIDGPPLYNATPLADAGEDQLVGLQELVVLDGSGSSDPDGNIASSFWSQIQGNAVTLSQATSLTSSFTTPDHNDSLQFVLSVTDNEGLTSLDTVRVTVTSSSAIITYTSISTSHLTITPNPFNASTIISFPVGVSDLAIDVFDILGRKIISLANHTAGQTSNTIFWDGTDQYGAEIISGIYLVHFQSRTFREIRKVTVLK